MVGPLILCVTASITIMKSSGLNTEPWCTPTFTQNHSLTHPPYDLILVLACLYIAITALTTTLQHLTSSWPTQLLSLALCQRLSPGQQMPTTVSCAFRFLTDVIKMKTKYTKFHFFQRISIEPLGLGRTQVKNHWFSWTTRSQLQTVFLDRVGNCFQ